jgi:hypothetical protein
MEIYIRLGIIVIKADAGGIGILASSISVQYRSIPVPDWVSNSGSGLVLASVFIFIPVTD